MESQFQRHRVSYADNSRRLTLVVRTDIEPQFFQLDHLLALLLVEQMDGLAGDDGGHGPLRGPDRHALTDQLLGIPAANRFRVDEAGVINLDDQHADLIAVPGVHDSERGSRVAAGDDVAVDIGRHAVGEWSGIVANHLLNRTFIARRAGSLQKGLQEPPRVVIHEIVSQELWPDTEIVRGRV